MMMEPEAVRALFDEIEAQTGVHIDFNPMEVPDIAKLQNENSQLHAINADLLAALEKIAAHLKAESLSQGQVVAARQTAENAIVKARR